jgi:hypothetical protein
MADPLGVLPTCPGAATTEVKDIDDRPPGCCCQHVWKRPPLKLKTSMVDPWWVLAAGLAAATTEVGDVDGGLLGGAGARSDSDHH